MGDSREVSHVNIVRKLRHSCEDVNFASSIYSNTLKQFNFIVDFCLSLHITYKHSQTRSEHFLYKPITKRCPLKVHASEKSTPILWRYLWPSERNIGDISRDLNNCWIVEENSFPSMYHKGFNISRFFCNTWIAHVWQPRGQRSKRSWRSVTAHFGLLTLNVINMALSLFSNSAHVSVTGFTPVWICIADAWLLITRKRYVLMVVSCNIAHYPPPGNECCFALSLSVVLITCPQKSNTSLHVMYSWQLENFTMIHWKFRFYYRKPSLNVTQANV